MFSDFGIEWVFQRLGNADVSSLGDETRRNLEGLEPVVLVASVLDDDVDARVLARMLQMDERRLIAPLSVLAAKGVLVARRDHTSTHYAFADQNVRQRAYQAIPGETLIGLHREAAMAQAEIIGAPASGAVFRTAMHWQRAGEPMAMLRSCRVAAERAVAEAAPIEAVAYLRHALAASRKLAGGNAQREELSTLQQLGPLQAQMTGSGSLEVAEIYARCLEIADGLDDAEAAGCFDVIWGLAAWFLVHGRIGAARDLCDRLLRSASASDDAAHKLLASRLAGLGLLLGGEFGAAIEAFANVEQLYDFERHAGLRFRYASDQSALALAHKAWAQTIAGNVEAADRTSIAALEQAQWLEHPHTSAHVTCVLAARAQVLGRRHMAAPLATAGLAMSVRHGFTYWKAWAEMLLGWHLAGRDAIDGASRITAAIADYRRTGAGQALPFAHLLLAGIALESGNREAAADAADAAIDASAAYGVAMFDAEIWRIKAMAISDEGRRKVVLQRGLVIAQRQGARLFEARLAEALHAGPA